MTRGAGIREAQAAYGGVNGTSAGVGVPASSRQKTIYNVNVLSGDARKRDKSKAHQAMAFAVELLVGELEVAQHGAGNPVANFAHAAR